MDLQTEWGRLPMSDKKDSRLYKRIELLSAKVQATLVVVTETGVQGAASAYLVPVKDFSKSGMGVYSKVLVPKQSLVKVSIEGVPCDPLEGRVVWAGEDKNGPPGLPFCLGIDFMPRDDAARENQLETYRYVLKLVS